MITGLYTGILAFILVGLLWRVMSRRMKYKVGLGDGGIADLTQAIRGHGNFIETTPILLIIMLLMELSLAQPWFLHVYGITLVASRVLSAWGLSQSQNLSFGRKAGIMLTWGLLLIGGVILVMMYIKY